MLIESFVGRWKLVGSSYVYGEIATVGDQTDPQGVSAWLNGTGEELEGSINSASGLELEVSQDGRFSERPIGEPQLEWFDVEGVLSENVASFGGVLATSQDVIYMQPDAVPSWSVHMQNRYGKAVLRYDDGDTKISECLRVQGDRLLRTVNVVTDEAYTNRVLIVYAREP